jgi:magnesium transporter
MESQVETSIPLLRLARRFVESDPIGAAHTLETMELQEAASVLKELPPSLLAQVFRYLPARLVTDLVKEVPRHLFRQILERLDPEQAAAILLELPNDLRQVFLERLSQKAKRQIQEILTYPEDSAGRIMTRQFLALHTDTRVRDAIQRIRLLANRRSTDSYAYVTDSENRLVGVINMRDLIVATSDATLGSIMRKNVFSVDCFMDREQVAAELSKRRYFAVPVVDPENRLLGIIKSDQLIEHVQEEATEDIQMLFGAGGDERAFSPIGLSLRKRLPWLYLNLATAFLAASVVALFEDVIAKITVLAVFLPVVAGQGGNAGIQTLAVVMRGLVLREIRAEKAWRLLGREALLGTLNGLTIGLVTGLVAWIWHGNPFLGVVIGLAMVVNLVVAGLSGAAIPLSMKAIGLDPAQSSGIILTTVTDVVGFFAFLGIAVLFESYLVIGT